PLSDFEKINFNCENVIITENKMTFLALPSVKSAIAVWSGGGFMISYLKNVLWLHEKKIAYWGDLDSHGFTILNQLRTYFPQTVSTMMDMETFELFKKEGLVPGEKTNAINLSKLSEAEMKVFTFLKESNFRLEQEKIRQNYVDALFRERFRL
ncbi:MAG: Wadjet anti-phage system protein JetD domain-containing protein, partial [Chitinophagaceae bacterium]